MKKLFISQPMRGKTDEEILKERKVLIADVYMKTHEEIEVIDSFFERAPADATPLWYLGESLKLLGTADFVVFAPGWQDYRGCRIEHDAAVAYGIPIVEVVTAIVAVATSFTAIDKAWDTLLAKWKKHKAPEEAQNAEISALKTQIQQITPRLDAVEGQLTAMGKTVNDLHTGNLAVLHDRIYQMCRLCIKRGYITEDDLNNLKYLYDSYHSQGGNGTGTELYKRAKALPIRIETE